MPSLRHRIGLAAAFLALCALYYFWSWSEELGDLGGDNAVYLLTAQYFSPWTSGSALAKAFAQSSKFPPLYPLLLGTFGDGKNLLAAHAATTTLLLLAFAVLYLWLRSLRFRAVTAACAVVVVALLPGFLLQALLLLSENLFLLATLACLAAASAHEDRPRPALLWSAAAAVAAATLARTAGVALAGAFIVYLSLRRPPGWQRAALIAVVPSLLWYLLNSGHAPGYVHDWFGSYHSGALAGALRQVSEQCRALALGWLHDLSLLPAMSPLVAALGLLCLGAAAWRAWRIHLDGLYVLAYGAIVVLWPYPAEAARLVLVLIPVLLVQGLLAVRAMLRSRAELAVPVLLGVAAFIAAPSAVLIATRFMLPMPPQIAPFKRSVYWYQESPVVAASGVVAAQAVVSHLKIIAASVPESECIYAIKPSIVAFYSGRRAVAPPPSRLDAAGFSAALAHGCRYFYLTSFTSPSYGSPYYPSERLSGELELVSAAIDLAPDVPAAVLAMRRSDVR